MKTFGKIAGMKYVLENNKSIIILVYPRTVARQIDF